MRDTDNIRSLLELSPDYIGFIFYDKSPRFVGEDFDLEITSQVAKNVKKTGVFINADLDYIFEKSEKYNLEAIQLHGDESTSECETIKSKGLQVIKAFRVDADFNFKQTEPYESVCDYFLFDTKTKAYGGSGKKFPWDILDNYKGKTPFFLSGGIGESDEKEIKQLKHPKLFAVDLNSKFENEPAFKNIEKLKVFFGEMDNEADL